MKEKTTNKKRRKECMNSVCVINHNIVHDIEEYFMSGKDVKLTKDGFNLIVTSCICRWYTYYVKSKKRRKGNSIS